MVYVTDFSTGQLIFKVCKLKYLEAFKGYKHSAASHHSRILKWNSCSDSLWFNAAADATDRWALTQGKEVGLLLTPSGYYRELHHSFHLHAYWLKTFPLRFFFL